VLTNLPCKPTTFKKRLRKAIIEVSSGKKRYVKTIRKCKGSDAKLSEIHPKV
jgi:hypothetical protein